MIHPESIASTELLIEKVDGGRSPQGKNILHIKAGYRTLCGRKFLKLTSGICIADVDSFFGKDPLRSTETLCVECEKSTEYEERYALWLLANAGEE